MSYRFVRLCYLGLMNVYIMNMYSIQEFKGGYVLKGGSVFMAKMRTNIFEYLIYFVAAAKELAQTSYFLATNW